MNFKKKQAHFKCEGFEYILFVISKQPLKQKRSGVIRFIMFAFTKLCDG